MAALLAAEEAEAESDDFDADEVVVMLHRARTLIDSGALDAEQAEQLQLKIEEIEQTHQAGERRAVADRMDELVDLLFELEA